MQLELGPTAAGDVRDWARFARRLICEMRVGSPDLEGLASADFLSSWSQLIDDFDQHASVSERSFRWSGSVDVELAGYLLHGLNRCIQSPELQTRCTAAERQQHSPFTLHLIQSFIDGLSTEGQCHVHLVDQVRATLGELLDH